MSRGSRLRERLRGRTSLFALALLLCAVFVAASGWALRGGLISSETWVFLPYHMSHRPLLKLIFNYNVLDFGTYRGREFSFLCDHLDFWFVAACIRRGFVHYLSITHFLAGLAVAGLLRRFCSRDMGLDGLASACVALIFLTSPPALLSGSCFRTAKTLAALLLVVVYLLCRRLLRDRAAGPSSPGARAALVFAAALPAVFIDEQGAFLTAALGAYALVEWARTRDSSAASVAGGIGAALLCFLVYFRFAGPFLIRSLYGCPVGFEYQRLPWGQLMADPRMPLWTVATALVDVFRFLCGNPPRLLAVALLGVFGWLLAAPAPPAGQRAPWRAALLEAGRRHGFTLFAVCLLAMYAGMWMRLPETFGPWPERVYYFLPSTALLALAAARAAGAAREQGLLPRWALRCALGAALFGNLQALPGHIEVARAYDPDSRSPRVMEALRMLHDPARPASWEPSEEVLRNPIYMYFRTGRNPCDPEPPLGPGR